uniref:Uncharacterized protein n=1 Tax=Buteo japonicus TaxID=224669 RepID=A0A8C0BN10_9AVES
MSPVPSWWTWSPAQWTLCAPAPLDRSSGPTTLSLVSEAGLATTGPRGTTRKAPSWWTPSWTW